jgi:hypothetical protein
MGKKPDFIDDVLRIFVEAAPTLRSEQVAAIEQRIRLTWGGEDVYIGKRAAQGKVLRLAEELRAGVDLGQAMCNAGLSRRTGYRLLSRRWRVR